MEEMVPPDNYGQVDTMLHRGATPNSTSIPFLRRLALRSVVQLSPESLSTALTHFFAESNITVLNLGMKYGWNRGKSWRVIPDEMVKEAIEWSYRLEHRPVLFMCTSGLFETGIVVGCLRRLQGWDLLATVAEYRSFAGVKARFVNEQFMELFDLELVNACQLSRN